MDKNPPSDGNQTPDFLHTRLLPSYAKKPGGNSPILPINKTSVDQPLEVALRHFFPKSAHASTREAGADEEAMPTPVVLATDGVRLTLPPTSVTTVVVE